MKTAAIAIVPFIALFLSCSQKDTTTMPASELVPAQTGSRIGSVNTADDEHAFKSFLTQFKAAVKKEDLAATAVMMHFPFYTCQFQNDNGYTLPCDPVTNAEFREYGTLIYNNDVLRFLPLCKNEDITDVTKTGEAYYNELYKATDPGSKLYEVYKQYPETSTQAESYFGFVFGRIKGKYKVLAFYSKWPVKG